MYFNSGPPSIRAVRRRNAAGRIIAPSREYHVVYWRHGEGGDPVRKSDHRYTYGEYCTWDDEERWEIIDGVAWNTSPAPRTEHQWVSGEIFRQFANHLRGAPCKVFAAPFDVVLTDRPGQSAEDSPTVVQPDICVICDRSKITEAGCTGAPDLVIEILSPSTMRKDLEIKRRLYERHRVREYWIVDPVNRCVHVYLLDPANRYADTPRVCERTGRRRPEVGSTVLQGFALELDAVFAE